MLSIQATYTQWDSTKADWDPIASNSRLLLEHDENA